MTGIKGKSYRKHSKRKTHKKRSYKKRSYQTKNVKRQRRSTKRRKNRKTTKRRKKRQILEGGMFGPSGGQKLILDFLSDNVRGSTIKDSGEQGGIEKLLITEQNPVVSIESNNLILKITLGDNTELTGVEYKPDHMFGSIVVLKDLANMTDPSSEPYYTFTSDKSRVDCKEYIVILHNIPMKQVKFKVHTELEGDPLTSRESNSIVNTVKTAEVARQDAEAQAGDEIEQFNKTKVKELKRNALKLRNKKDYAGAAEQYEYAIELDPTDTDLPIMRSKAIILTERYESDKEKVINLIMEAKELGLSDTKIKEALLGDNQQVSLLELIAQYESPQNTRGAWVKGREASASQIGLENWRVAEERRVAEGRRKAPNPDPSEGEDWI